MFYFLVTCLHFKHKFLGVQMCSTKRIINNDRSFRHEENQQWICLIIGKAFDAHYSTSATDMHGSFIHCSLVLLCRHRYLWLQSSFIFLLLHQGSTESIDCVTYTETIYWLTNPITNQYIPPYTVTILYNRNTCLKKHI